MKTATEIRKSYGCMTLHFQFPIRWDEDCNNSNVKLTDEYMNAFSSLYVGMKTATQTIYNYVLDNLVTFSSLYVGMKTATYKEVS